MLSLTYQTQSLRCGNLLIVVKPDCTLELVCMVGYWPESYLRSRADQTRSNRFGETSQDIDYNCVLDYKMCGESRVEMSLVICHHPVSFILP